MPTEPELEVSLDETHITIKIPLLDLSELSKSGKCHIVAQTSGWTKTDLVDPSREHLHIMIPPLTIISK